MINVKSIDGRVLYTFEVESLEEAPLRGLDLRGADFYMQFLYGGDLRGSDLRGADFRGADLIGADLRNTDLRGADFRLNNIGQITRLLGANLDSGNLDGAFLTGAEYDSKTVFPKGFDPDEHGMCRYPAESLG